jgi:hypothetical protein
MTAANGATTVTRNVPQVTPTTATLDFISNHLYTGGAFQTYWTVFDYSNDLRNDNDHETNAPYSISFHIFALSPLHDECLQEERDGTLNHPV